MPPSRPLVASLAGALILLAALPAAALVPLPITQVRLPCDDLAGVPPAQGVVCGVWSPRADLPAPREGLRLAWLDTEDVLLAFGGRDASGAPAGDLWAYDPANDAWSARASGPPARADAGFVAENLADKAYLVGGRDAAGARADVWVYDYSADTWSAPATTGGPSPRYGALAAWDLVNSRVLVFGGTDGTQTSGEFWGYTPANNVWTKLTGGPAARSFPAGTWDPARQGVMFTGGVGADGAERNDTWFYPVIGGAGWQQFGDSPAVGAHATPAWDFHHATLHVFAGESLGALTGDSAMYFASRNLWITETDVPSPRADAAGEYDIANHVSFVAGGRTAAGLTDEFWAFETALIHAWM